MSDENPENKTQHLHILMAPSEVEAIDEWGFKNRIRTRAEAIRRLCQMGMALDARLPRITVDLAKTQQAANEAYGKVLNAQIEAQARGEPGLLGVNMAFLDLYRNTGNLAACLEPLIDITRALINSKDFQSAMKEVDDIEVAPILEQIAKDEARWKKLLDEARDNAPIDASDIVPITTILSKNKDQS